MATRKKAAEKQNETGLAYFEGWDIEKAITAFQAAVAEDPDNPEYLLNLARVFARGGDYEQAMPALGRYLQVETVGDVAARFERLFSSSLDEVETLLIEAMRRLDLTIAQIGKGIQMWLEFRITLGRRPFRTPKPELWAAAITYAIVKVNFVNLKRIDIADAYGINERSLKEKYDEIVQTLDLMPADYRYFSGEQNPLDKLVEAARLLEELDRNFQED
jgi:tetratricopeptide (TPR) repeat protein